MYHLWYSCLLIYWYNAKRRTVQGIIDSCPKQLQLYLHLQISINSLSDKEKEAEKEKNKKDALGMFYSSPHYMKLYDVLKGAYSNYKVCTCTYYGMFIIMLVTSHCHRTWREYLP